MPLSFELHNKGQNGEVGYRDFIVFGVNIGIVFMSMPSVSQLTIFFQPVFSQPVFVI